MNETAADWRHEARTLLAAGYGQRETARRLGVPEDRLRKWAQRAGIKASPVIVPSVPYNLKRVPSVPSAAAVIQDDAERLGPEARHIAARIAHKSLQHVEHTVDADPEAGLVALDSALTAGKLLQASNARGWERQPTSQEQHTHLHLHQAAKPLT